MLDSHIALVANDQRIASAIQAAVKRISKHPVFICSVDSIRDHLEPDTTGLLLFVSTDSATAEQGRQLLKEICLRKLAPTVVIIETDEGPSRLNLAGVSSSVTLRAKWPEEEPALAECLRQHAGRSQFFSSLAGDCLEERIRRMLAAQTPSLLAFVKPLALAAAHDVTILLTGETGTGKTHLARLIHECSPRKNNRFLTVPCGAISANLLESEFFGHVKGAFTGAEQAKIGKFGAVGNGTLLLDEIDALSLEQQTSLLRVIETGEYEPVGSTETKTCTARIIVASNWDIASAVEKGEFRRDLYYRLNVMSFYLPPLRERVQDIEPLARGLAARFSNKYCKDLFDISPKAMRALEGFPWRGNIRQLENVIQQAVLVSAGPELQFEDLPALVQESATQSNGNVNGNGTGHATPANSLSQGREAYERNIIRQALQDAGFSRTRAASILGVSRVTLYKKMKKYGLNNLPGRGSGALALPSEFSPVQAAR